MKYLLLAGRILFAAIFILSGFSHFSAQSIAYGASQGVPAAQAMVPFSGLLAIIGGSLIILGFKAKWGAWLLILFLIPVTFMMHQFWNIPDPQVSQIQHAMFMKNLSMLGGAIFIAYFGSGPLSMDETLSRKT
jgi:putative oxidoreductase